MGDQECSPKARAVVRRGRAAVAGRTEASGGELGGEGVARSSGGALCKAAAPAALCSCRLVCFTCIWACRLRGEGGPQEASAANASDGAHRRAARSGALKAYQQAATPAGLSSLGRILLCRLRERALPPCIFSFLSSASCLLLPAGAVPLARRCGCCGVAMWRRVEKGRRQTS